MRIFIKDDVGFGDEIKSLIYNYTKMRNIDAEVQIYSNPLNEIQAEEQADASLNEWLMSKREAHKTDDDSASLIIKKRNLVQKVPFRSIMYFSKEKHYTDVHTTKETLRYLIGFKELKEEIPEIYKHCFVQSYRSFIVNLAYVKSISKDMLKLFNEEEIPIGETYAKEVKAAFNEYIAREAI